MGAGKRILVLVGRRGVVTWEGQWEAPVLVGMVQGRAPVSVVGVGL